MTVSSYPLSWPQGFPRKKYRESSRFKTTLPAALENVQRSLRLFARDSGKQITNLVMSSNVTLGANKPDDPGVAVWFTWNEMQVCIPVDRYTKVEANLQAIHHIIEARRTELRHGTLELVKATFTGFKALPAPQGKHWRDVLQLTGVSNPTPEQVKQKYKALAGTAHPDAGGSTEKMAEINAARDTALREIGP